MTSIGRLFGRFAAWLVDQVDSLANLNPIASSTARRYGRLAEIMASSDGAKYARLAAQATKGGATVTKRKRSGNVVFIFRVPGKNGGPHTTIRIKFKEKI